MLPVVHGVVRSMRMLTRGQSYELEAGDSVELECQFYADSFNLFDYPVVWHKRQHHWPHHEHQYRRHHHQQPVQQAWPSDDHVDDDLVEDCQVNMMGNLLEPFASFDRYQSTHDDHSPKYIFRLSLTGE